MSSEIYFKYASNFVYSLYDQKLKPWHTNDYLKKNKFSKSI